MLERFLDQIGEVLRLCEDTDGILVVNREGIIEYHRIPLNSYWCSQDTVGRHILELYPELDGESSTILTALRTGRASYNVLQDINNHRGERVLLESTTIPIVVDGRVECVVDSSKYHTIDQRVIRGGEGGGLSTLDRMLTEDPAMLALKSRIRDVAGLDSSVLIYGETGTGKELVAESLHSEGGRAGPFVSQNCAAIPATLLESLFFGTEKGSYTGALTRKGLLEEADGGTLFLDEINSMDPALQAKLLKVLEEKKVRRLGGSRDIPFDVRIVAAVNEKPQKLIREGRLREDLYYRLGVIRLTLPPLRERLCDIGPLADYFIEHYNRKLHRRVGGAERAGPPAAPGLCVAGQCAGAEKRHRGGGGRRPGGAPHRGGHGGDPGRAAGRPEPAAGAARGPAPGGELFPHPGAGLLRAGAAQPGYAAGRLHLPGSPPAGPVPAEFEVQAEKI